MQNASEYYRDASPAAIRNGLEWYPETRAWCVRIAERHGVAIDTCAALVAVLSQRKQWRGNKHEVIRALHGHAPRTLGTVARKVARLLQGEQPEHVIAGDKITAFYHAIMGDSDAVVLDVWMLRAYGVENRQLTTKQYGTIADRLRRDAKRAGVTATVFQATVWVGVRGKHN